jgi:hypothetical protein
MREEEKLARDVYLAMQAKWDDRVFANIARAESRHMSAMAGILTRYGISDPVKNVQPGSFTAPQFQQLYQSLVAKGSSSLVDALQVGLKIEEMDIADLRTAMAATDRPDIKRVLQNLERGSQNHLRAFASRLNRAGGTYVATSLSQAEFDQIANSERQNGAGQRQSAGRGNRQSNPQGNAQGNAQRQGPGKGHGRGRGKGNRRGPGR